MRQLDEAADDMHGTHSLMGTPSQASRTACWRCFVAVVDEHELGLGLGDGQAERHAGVLAAWVCQGARMAVPAPPHGMVGLGGARCYDCSDGER